MVSSYDCKDYCCLLHFRLRYKCKFLAFCLCLLLNQSVVVLLLVVVSEVMIVLLVGVVFFALVFVVNIISTTNHHNQYQEYKKGMVLNPKSSKLLNIHMFIDFFLLP